MTEMETEVEVYGSVLSDDEIANLLSEARSKGDYDAWLTNFLKSGKSGVKVDRAEGILAGKSPEKVATGITNAVKRTDKEGKFVHPGAVENIQVIKRRVGEGEDAPVEVFVINKSVYQAAAS